MDYPSNLECPACGKTFAREHGLNSHLTTAKTCRWYKKGKITTLRAIDSPREHDIEGGACTIEDEDVTSTDTSIASPSGPTTRSAAKKDTTPPSKDSSATDSDSRGTTDEGEDPEDMVEEFYPEELFHFVPEDPSCSEIGQAGPGPSTLSMRKRTPEPSNVHSTFHCLDDDEDTRVEDEHPSAGRTIRMNKDLHQRWHDLFGPGKDREGDMLMGEGTIFTSGRSNGFAPFASELDWRVANWAIKEGVGHNAFDRLLSIPGVSHSI